MGIKHTGVYVYVAALGTQSTLQDAMGSHRGSATVMPNHHFRGQTGGEGCEARSLWLCVGELECRGGEGSAEGSAWCAHITLDDSRGVQRNSSMQFVGSHNLTSSPKAGC